MAKTMREKKFLKMGMTDTNASYFLPSFEFLNSVFSVFAIKMLLDKPYGLLNLLEFKCDHFSSFFQAESQFQNSNVGGK